MTFYVRRTKDSEIVGPFTIPQINQMLRQKQINFRSLALLDTGQGIAAVQSISLNQWMPVAQLPGFEPDPDEQRICLVKVLVIALIVGFFLVIGLILLDSVLRRIH